MIKWLIVNGDRWFSLKLLAERGGGGGGGGYKMVCISHTKPLALLLQLAYFELGNLENCPDEEGSKSW